MKQSRLPENCDITNNLCLDGTYVRISASNTEDL